MISGHMFIYCHSPRYSKILHTNPTKMSFTSGTCHMITSHYLFNQCLAIRTRFYPKLFHQPYISSCFGIIVLVDFTAGQSFMPFNLAKGTNMSKTFRALYNGLSWTDEIYLWTILFWMIGIEGWIY